MPVRRPAWLTFRIAANSFYGAATRQFWQGNTFQNLVFGVDHETFATVIGGYVALYAIRSTVLAYERFLFLKMITEVINGRDDNLEVGQPKVAAVVFFKFAS